MSNLSVDDENDDDMNESGQIDRNYHHHHHIKWINRTHTQKNINKKQKIDHTEKAFNINLCLMSIV